ncbi:GAF domain-containing protein [Rhodococcus sp. A5(2022)]|uniref:GAF domain-containing protein n=1 Tax=Rhodococcus sp. A5(2022) TaxID=3003588 RepID=UPI0022A86E82|nr:GAF domain-containing protein [Rhodococcus sp. A5(2022)]MCZ1075110.1 GAF domain-containing protein [Rhodococcus sp. A5(2022)]
MTSANGPVGQTTFRDVVRSSAAWADRNPLMILLCQALPIAGSAIVPFGFPVKDWGDRVTIAIGVLLVAIGVVIITAREVHKSRQETEAAAREASLSDAVFDAKAALWTAYKDALQPVAELLAAMPSMSKPDRKSQLKAVALQSVNAIQLLLDDVDRMRVVVYQIVDGNGRMEKLCYAGRSGTPPQPFVPGNPRGDLAIQMVLAGETVFTPDIDQEPPEQYQGSMKGYKTFISSAITNGQDAYGMITVDAPNAGDLVETHKQIVMLFADLLAIAFAEKER